MQASLRGRQASPASRSIQKRREPLRLTRAAAWLFRRWRRLRCRAAASARRELRDSSFIMDADQGPLDRHRPHSAYESKLTKTNCSALPTNVIFWADVFNRGDVALEWSNFRFQEFAALNSRVGNLIRGPSDQLFTRALSRAFPFSTLTKNSICSPRCLRICSDFCRRNFWNFSRESRSTDSPELCKASRNAR